MLKVLRQPDFHLELSFDYLGRLVSEQPVHERESQNNSEKNKTLLSEDEQQFTTQSSQQNIAVHNMITAKVKPFRFVQSLTKIISPK